MYKILIARHLYIACCLLSFCLSNRALGLSSVFAHLVGQTTCPQSIPADSFARIVSDDILIVPIDFAVATKMDRLPSGKRAKYVGVIDDFVAVILSSDVTPNDYQRLWGNEQRCLFSFKIGDVLCTSPLISSSIDLRLRIGYMTENYRYGSVLACDTADDILPSRALPIEKGHLWGFTIFDFTDSGSVAFGSPIWAKVYSDSCLPAPSKWRSITEWNDYCGDELTSVLSTLRAVPGARNAPGVIDFVNTLILDRLLDSDKTIALSNIVYIGVLARQGVVPLDTSDWCTLVSRWINNNATDEVGVLNAGYLLAFSIPTLGCHDALPSIAGRLRGPWELYASMAVGQLSSDPTAAIDFMDQVCNEHKLWCTLPELYRFYVTARSRLLVYNDNRVAADVAAMLARQDSILDNLVAVDSLLYRRKYESAMNVSIEAVKKFPERPGVVDQLVAVWRFRNVDRSYIRNMR